MGGSPSGPGKAAGPSCRVTFSSRFSLNRMARKHLPITLCLHELRSQERSHSLRCLFLCVILRVNRFWKCSSGIGLIRNKFSVRSTICCWEPYTVLVSTFKAPFFLSHRHLKVFIEEFTEGSTFCPTTIRD